MPYTLLEPEQASLTKQQAFNITYLRFNIQLWSQDIFSWGSRSQSALKTLSHQDPRLSLTLLEVTYRWGLLFARLLHQYTVTTTRGLLAEERDSGAVVGLSLCEPAGPQGKSQSRERTLTDCWETFPQSNTQTEPHRAAKRTLVHHGDRRREGRGGRSDSYNNTAKEVNAMPYLLWRGPLLWMHSIDKHCSVK